MDLDMLHHQADNLLAVGRCRLGRGPECREIAGQAQDSSTLVLAAARWLFLQKAIIFFRKIAPISQRFLPLSLQAASHETILRLNRLVLPFGAFRLIGGPLQAVLPVAVQTVALLVHVLDRFQADSKVAGSKARKTCWATRSSTTPASSPQHVDPSFFLRVHS